MRKFLLPITTLILLITQVFGQSRTVTGKVSDSKGLPLQSVTVIVKGSNVSTQTNSEGNFSINAETGSTLVLSSVGYASQEVKVGSGSTVNATLQEQTNQLSEVVVTALGVSREKKTLGYSTTTFKTDEINRVSPVSVFDGLQGKIAGADISNVSGNPGGSSKVILRGYSSLQSSNQPLYVVDGVPVSDVRPGSEGLISPDALTNKGFNSPGYDYGNTANDINPGDIESLTVLKGAAATALYGSRATNGVIVITTKKGKSGKIKVDVNSSAVFSQPAILPRLQKQFGQGWDATFILSENGSWGPKLDGARRLWGSIVDNSQLIKPFSFVNDNVRDLYETGVEYNNSVSMSGGTENSTFLLSYGNIYSDGIIPTDNDSYRRNTVSLRGSTKYKNFSAEASFNYINKSQKFVESGQSASGVGSSFFEQILQIPVDIPIEDFRDYKNKFFNVDNYFTPFAENPYYTLYENGSKMRNDRFYGNVNLQYKFADWISLQVQQGFDITNSATKQWRNVNAPTPGSWNDGANPESAQRSADVGSVQEGQQKYYEYDTKANLQVRRNLNEDFSLEALAGINYNERGSNILYTYVEDLALPGFFDIKNGSSTPVSNHYLSKQAIFGAFGSATVGYKDLAYLTVTGRNDWSSTLPKGSNSYFYPSANVSFLLSNVLNVERNTLSYAKLRASYGKTGKDAPVYSVYDVINATTVLLPFGQVNFPFNNTVPGYSLSDLLGNQSLTPEISTETEFGGEFRLFHDRVSFDIAYYNKLSKGQIINTPITPSTGYSSVTLNFGKIRNRGVELTANFVPVRSREFTWEIGYNFTRNRNEVLELPQGLNKVTLNTAYDTKLEARLNQPLGVFYAPVPKRDPSGRVVVDANTGFPVGESEDGYYGSAQRDYSMGLINSFSYKGFRLGVSLDYRKGGVFYSSTAELLMFTGNSYQTVYNDRKPFIIPNSVNEQVDADGKVTYVENTTALDEAHQDDYYYQNSNRAGIYPLRILDKSFLKVRDITLSYTLPANISRKITADRIVITLIGRNLFTWLPKENQIIDPEVSSFGRDLGSELGEFRVGPTARSLGASIRVTF